MVTIIEMIKAISTALESTFPNVEVINMDIDKEYPRPCIYITVESGSDGTVAGLLEQTHTLGVYYFAASIEKGFLELLKARNTLSEMLRQPMNVSEDFYIQPQNVAYEINRADMALKVHFDVQTVQEPEDAEAELIETLVINIKKE